MSGQLREEIVAAFANAGLSNVSNDILSKCVAVSSNWNITPAQMADCWEAHSLNKNLSSLNEHSYPGFHSLIVKDLDYNKTSSTSAVTHVPRPKRDNSSQSSSSSALVTPAHTKRYQQQSNSASSEADRNDSGHRRISLSPGEMATTNPSPFAPQPPVYDERKNSGEVIFTFNPSKLAQRKIPEASHGPRCRILHGDPGDENDAVFSKSPNVTAPYRHYFTVLDERALALDRQLQATQDLFVERYNFGSSSMEEDHHASTSLEAVGVPRQEKICCIGRICNSAHEGRMNPTSILLEGSRHASGGERVELDLSELNKNAVPYSLFPGQIVAVEGVNTSGRKMVASNIHEGVPHAPMKSTVRDLLQFHHSDAFQGGSPLQIVTAAGPFTCSDNLDYQPLMDFLTNMVVQKPDVIILTGPFVDIRHKTIAAGLTTMETGSYDDDGGTTEILVPMEIFFANKIARALEIFFEADESLQTQFVVIPSLDDATAEWVYPQPPFTDRRPGGGKALNVPGFDADFTIGTLGFEGVETVGRGESKSRRVHCLSNPCTFKINEVVIGVTATDVLCHLSAEESNGNLEANSRMGHIAEHLLQQRSYYPLFPGSCEANLDLKHMNQWTIPCGLDVLILPSKLGAFCRPVLQNKTIVINSGQLTKSTTGGTYAELTLYPLPRKTLDEAGGDSVEFFHDIHERAAVQIQRI